MYLYYCIWPYSETVIFFETFSYHRKIISLQIYIVNYTVPAKHQHVSITLPEHWHTGLSIWHKTCFEREQRRAKQSYWRLSLLFKSVFCNNFSLLVSNYPKWVCKVHFNVKWWSQRFELFWRFECFWRHLWREAVNAGVLLDLVSESSSQKPNSVWH